MTFDREVDEAPRETRFVMRGGRTRQVARSPERSSEPTDLGTNDNEAVPSRTTTGGRIPPSQARGQEPMPRDTGKSVRTTRYEEGDSSVIDRLRPFYRIVEYELRNERIMRFPLAFNNVAVIVEALKIVEKMRYEDITRNFIEYTNGVSTARVLLACVS